MNIAKLKKLKNKNITRIMLSYDVGSDIIYASTYGITGKDTIISNMSIEDALNSVFKSLGMSVSAGDEIKPRIRYVVSKDSDDGSFRKGDHIMKHDDGSIICIEQLSWVTKEDVPEAITGAEFIVDKKWIVEKRKKLNESLNELDF